VAIRNSIDRGVPVQYVAEEDGIIIGYGNEGSRWWCLHPYHKGGSEGFWHDEVQGMAGGTWPWMLMVWTEPAPAAERASEQSLLASALEQAVEMWRTEKRGDYFVGEAAYGRWLDWLRRVDDGATEDEARGGMQGNAWYFDVLVHCRRIGAEWLKAQAAELEGDAGQTLAAAGESYAKIVETCLEGISSTWDLAMGGRRFDEWSEDQRRDQADRLRAARDLDASAIDSIEKALKSLS
jgi:hypothetical protein